MQYVQYRAIIHKAKKLLRYRDPRKSGGGYFLKKHLASKSHEVFFHCRLDIR